MLLIIYYIYTIYIKYILPINGHIDGINLSTFSWNLYNPIPLAGSYDSGNLAGWGLVNSWRGVCPKLWIIPVDAERSTGSVIASKSFFLINEN